MKVVDKKCERCHEEMKQVNTNRRFCSKCSAWRNHNSKKLKGYSSAEWQARKKKWRYKCPMCGKMKSKEKYCRCYQCQEIVLKNNIVDTVILEHRVIV